MDQLVFTFLPLVFTVTIVIITLRALRYSRFNHEKLNLPPGPPCLPIVGNLHQLIRSLPHQRMRDLSRSYGPLMHLQMGEVRMVVASSAEAAKEILKTHDVNFASRPKFHSFHVLSYGSKGLGSSPYGEYWRQLRKICTVELLSAKRVLSFRSTREEEVYNLIHSISLALPTKLINLTEMLTSTVNNIAATTAIGSKYKAQATFVEVMNEILEVSAGFSLVDLFPSLSRLLSFFFRSKSKAEILHQKMDGILEGIIQEHKANKIAETDGSSEPAKEDFIDVLLRLQAGRDLPFDLTADCIKASVLDMFAAGSETSSTLLIWIMSELMKNPRVMKKAQSEVRRILKGKTIITESDIGELSYLQLVIKETLRLHPPVPLLLPRECRETCEILGYTIPEKTRVAVNVWAIGRDPNYWEDAEEFKPERFEVSARDFKGTCFEFLPFGAGRRMCPGMLLGIANLELALVRLLYHFEWKLPDGLETEDFDMKESFGITAQRSSDLCLHAIPHT